MKSPSEKTKLALGTVQFGLPYGVANQQGQVSLEEANAILNQAWSAEIDTLDTAIAYGSSEQRLGDMGVNHWRIVSKLPSLPEGQTNVPVWVEQSLEESLKRLKIDKLYGLLLHRPKDLLSSQGQTLYNSLCALKERGWVQKIGISIYGPEELEALVAEFEFDMVQAPFNVLDRRLIQSGWLARLHQSGVEVHVRSMFLQGLLLMAPAARPVQFGRWNTLWHQWQQWLADTNLTPLQACLRFGLNQPGIDRVLVGVDSLVQFQEILEAATGDIPEFPDTLYCDDLDLINPARWQL
ncbi:aldo/keto reductase [Moorena producens]|uniref:aldo/keto reductase n=1 Tax=Moorena producens TaxID=1155739 RepID=UPI003C740F7B